MFATAVVGAIGQRVLPELANELGLELTRNGTIVTDTETFQTKRPGIFACGDCQTGADIAVRAIGNGRKTTVAVDQYLKGERKSGVNLCCSTPRWVPLSMIVSYYFSAPCSR